MIFSAVAYRGWFRLYSIATLVVVIGFGGATSIAIRGIEQNHTPWAGGFERINAYTYFAWLVVLAVTVIRRSLHQVPPEKSVPEVLSAGAQPRPIDPDGGRRLAGEGGMT